MGLFLVVEYLMIEYTQLYYELVNTVFKYYIKIEIRKQIKFSNSELR